MMAVATDQTRADIKIVDKNIDSALRLALKDPLANADIIADLTQLKQDCSIAVKSIDNEAIAIASYYTDLPYNSLSLLVNSEDDTRQLIDELTGKHPQLRREPVFGLYTKTVTEIIEHCYKIIQKTPEIKMVLNNPDIPERLIDNSRYRLERLITQDLVQISHLYSLESAMDWTPKALTYGPYYGVYSGDDLVSIAGVQFAIKWAAEIANVVTHFKHRRQNLAYCCTKSVADKLKESCDNIFLCVLADNAPAIKLYEKMGFVKTEELYLVQYFIKGNF